MILSPFIVFIGLFSFNSCDVQAMQVRSISVPQDTAPAETYEGPDMIPLYPDGLVPPPLPKAGDEVQAKITEQIVDHVVCHVYYKPGNVFFVDEPELRPYLLSGTSNPAFIVIPGGGAGFLAWEREGTRPAEWLNSINISAFVLKYRVPSQHDSIDMDAQRAISFVRHNAAKYGVDPSRIGVMGFSAGGKISAAVSVLAEPLYPKIDKVDEADFHPNISLVIYGDGPHHIDSSMRTPPPTFSVSSEDDPCVPAAKANEYCEAVKAVGVECERRVYPNGGHGYGTCDPYYNKWSGDAVCDWTNKASEFLRQHGY